VSESVSKRERQDMLDSLALCGPTTSSCDCGMDSQLYCRTEGVSAFPKTWAAMSSVSWLLGEKELSSL